MFSATETLADFKTLKIVTGSGILIAIAIAQTIAIRLIVLQALPNVQITLQF
ncbi:MAG: hypothetical protein V7K48_22465 [Nostoc sp.]